MDAVTTAGQREVQAYIAAAPEAARPMLRQLRRLIRAAAPRANERLSYGIPFYEQNGRVAYFAGYQRHVGLYLVGEAKNRHAKELKRYRVAKATARFPIGEPLPVALITKLVKARIKENQAKVGSA